MSVIAMHSGKMYIRHLFRTRTVNCRWFRMIVCTYMHILMSSGLFYHRITFAANAIQTILDLQLISRDTRDNVSHPRWLVPTIELIKYSFVLCLSQKRLAFEVNR